MGNPNLPPPYGANPQMPTYPPSYPQGPSSYPQPQPQGPINTNPTAPQILVVPSQPAQRTAPIITPVGPHPTNQTCRSCNASIQTRIETHATSSTHLWALVLCILGCWPCCLIPYCVDDCQSVNHYCPNCNAYIGSYKD